MPRVKIDYVVSFSSEDPEHPASNLLLREVSKKKWLCKKGDTSCSVVLQLPRSVKITGVHIGAYHTALVEVLVGRSETSSEQFQVLVPSSVFISREESRRDVAVPRVRSFGCDALSAAARDQRWDRVRLVCSQPHNKHAQFGLSFVHVDEAEGAVPAVPAVAALTARLLALDALSSDEDDFKPGELFAKHRQSAAAKETHSNTSANTGAQIRQATSQALKNIAESSTKLTKTSISKPSASSARREHSAPPSAPSPPPSPGDRARDALLYSRHDAAPHQRIDQVLARHRHESDKMNDTQHKTKDDAKTKDDNKTKNDAKTKDYVKTKTDVKIKHESQIKTVPKTKDEPKKTATRNDNDAPPRNHGKPTADHNKDARKRRRSGSQEQAGTHAGPLGAGLAPGPLGAGLAPGPLGAGLAPGPLGAGLAPGPLGAGLAPGPLGAGLAPGPLGAGLAPGPLGAGLAPGPRSAAPHTLLRGAALVLSGYENPRRARVRDLALALGARVLRDWGPDATHLICAFPNTPKLRTVRSSAGPAVPVLRADWLDHVSRRRRVLPWRWFATETKHLVKPSPEQLEDDDPEPDTGRHTQLDSDSGDDTEEEIQKVLQAQKKRRLAESSTDDEAPSSPAPSTSAAKPGSDAPDGDSTDEEPPGPLSGSLGVSGALPDFFSGLTFAIVASPSEVQRMARYVCAYGGELREMCEVEAGSAVDYIVQASTTGTTHSTTGTTRTTHSTTGTTRTTHSTTGTTRTTHSTTGTTRTTHSTTVPPAWLARCHDARALLPHDQTLTDVS